MVEITEDFERDAKSKSTIHITSVRRRRYSLAEFWRLPDSDSGPNGNLPPVTKSASALNNSPRYLNNIYDLNPWKNGSVKYLGSCPSHLTRARNLTANTFVQFLVQTVRQK